MDDVPDLRYARTADGVAIGYQAVGDGPTLVWLPSLSNIRAQWRVPVLREAYLRLAREFRLVLYDGRGMGSSDRRVDPADLGVAAHVRDLAAVLDAVAPDVPVSLFGQYHGVATAVAFAADEPDRVERMVLFGGALRMRDAMAPAQTQALLSLVDQDWDLFADAAATAWLGWAAGPSARLVAEGFRTAATPAIAKAWFVAAAEIDVTDLAGRVVAPSLVIHRQGERQIPVEVSRQLAAALPRGRLLALADSTPTMFLDDLPGDLAAMTAFLRDGDPIPAGKATPVAGTPLTARERDVLRLLAGGDSNAEIGRRLGIAVHTVERHVANLYRKIGARGRADATAYALRRGLD